LIKLGLSIDTNENDQDADSNEELPSLDEFDQSTMEEVD